MEVLDFSVQVFIAGKAIQSWYVTWYFIVWQYNWESQNVFFWQNNILQSV